MTVITVGARGSRLSLKQVEEVIRGIRYHHPDLRFVLKCFSVKGDRDLKTSLRDMEKTNFFTEEIDRHLLDGACRIAVHSAKDLPDPLPKGLQIVALTDSVSSEDVVVVRSDSPLFKKRSISCRIATSSLRREENIRKLFPKADLVDIRGTIERRLSLLRENSCEGVVVAKAALMRLSLQHLPMLPLPGVTAKGQGSLAVVARTGDAAVADWFSRIDSRRNGKALYFGLDPSGFLTAGTVTHFPLIEVRRLRSVEDPFAWMHAFTHVLFTSRTTVRLLTEELEKNPCYQSLLQKKIIVSIGEETTKALRDKGLFVSHTARKESQEGLITLFEKLPLTKNSFIFYPKSSLSRPLLTSYFERRGVRYRADDFYETVEKPTDSLPDLTAFRELVFTSPSTIRAFFAKYTTIPREIEILFKGEVTEREFKKFLLQRI